MTSQDRYSLLLYQTCLIGCFLGGVATVYFLFGLAGYVGSPILNAFTAAGIILAALFFLYVFCIWMPDRSRLGLSLWLLVFAILLVEIVLGLVPPAARDELTHHLAIPKLYVNAGKIVEISFAPYSYYPMLLDMLYTPFVGWKLDSVPKLVHGLFAFLTGLLIYSYLAHRLNHAYGLLGFLVFISTPIILRLSNLAYVDLGLVFYSTASLLCILQWAEGGGVHNPQSAIRNPHSDWLIIAALAAGFTLTTKPNGFLSFFLLFAAMVLSQNRDQQKSLLRVVGYSALFGIIALIPFSPWALKNLVQTGNPFFPFFGGWFSGVESGGGGVVGNVGVGIFATRKLLYGESWWEIAALPLRIFFAGEDDNPRYFDGVLNPILILFLPWSFKGKWLDEKKILFGFALFYFLYALFLVNMRIRYILPIVPVLAILAVYGIHNIYLRISRPSLLFGAITLLLALNGAYVWSYFDKVSPIKYLLGTENRDEYLVRRLPEYPAVKFISQDLSSSGKIYFIFVGRRAYYCECNYFYDGNDDNPWILLRMIQRSQGGNEVKMKLQRQGLTYLLVRDDLLAKFLHNNLDSQDLKVWRSFTNHHLEAIFHSRGYSVYRVHG